MSSDDDSNQCRREKFASERFDNDGQKVDDTNDADAFMPALPPHLLRKKTEEVKDDDAEKNSVQETDDCVYGPVLPKHLNKKVESDVSKPLYGPKIPDTIKPKPVIGPSIPEHLLKSSQFEEKEETCFENQDSMEDEDTFFGPSPSLMAKEGSVNYSRIFDKKEKKEEKTVAANQRESWMLELPSEKAANLGLGPRTFRTKIPDKGGDRSEWTDTPADKERKRKNPTIKDDSSLVKQKGIEERDKEMEKLARKAEKKLKRDESLLEIHMKKMKKKAKKEAKKREKEGKPVERRPFNRETDLQVNRFDESQKRAVLKKAQLLNDRFSQDLALMQKLVVVGPKNTVEMKILVVMVLLAFTCSRIVRGETYTCECSVFESPTPANRTDEPIISKMFPAVSCNKTMCQESCVAAAEHEKDKGGEILCPILVATSKPFMPYVYYRICDEPEWIYTELVPTVKFCCSNKAPVSCDK